jgi:hypothetical protein
MFNKNQFGVVWNDLLASFLFSIVLTLFILQIYRTVKEAKRMVY